MEFLNIEGIKLVIIFFIPGFISIKVYELLVPSTKRDFSSSVLDVISYSCINYAILFWVPLLIHQKRFIEQHFIWYVLLIILVVFIFPIIWSVILVKLRSSKFLKGRIIHPTPKAWDYFFSLGKSSGKSVWVLVHLNNGNKIGGVIGTNSFTSSFPNEQDIYLEEVWHVDKEGVFQRKIDRTAGLLINDREIEYLEFFE